MAGGDRGDREGPAAAARLVHEVNQHWLHARFDNGLLEVSDLLEKLSYKYLELDRVEDALLAARLLVPLAVGWVPDPRCVLAEILLRAGQKEESAQLWAVIKADTPDDIWLYNAAGFVYRIAKDHETALDWLTEGLELALRTGDPEMLVGQLGDARLDSLIALGRPADEWDGRADRFLATHDYSARTGNHPRAAGKPEEVGSRALVLGVRRFAQDAADAGEPPLDRRPRGLLEFVDSLLPRLEKSWGDIGYRVDVRRDPDRAALLAGVTEALDEVGHPVVVHVISHGEVADDRSRVDIVPACGRTGVGTNVSEWVSAAQQRRSPVLFLLDLCRAGRVARLPWLAERAGRNTRAWVIAGAGPDEDAFDGRFSLAVAEVLERLAADGLGTDRGVRYVSFTTVARHIGERVAAMPGLPQQVHATAIDPAAEPPDLPFFPNPRFVDDPRRGVWQAIESPLRRFLDDLDDVFDADHFLDRAGLHFTGRREQLRELAPWLDGIGEGGLRLVTGGPGSGKSALLAALVCAAHPVLAEVAPHVRGRLDLDACPSLNDALAAVHARQRRWDELMASIGRQLELEPPAGGWTPETFLAGLADLPVVPVIVVDAVDEATDPVGVMRGLLPIAAATREDDEEEVCRLLVGLRPWPEFAPLWEFAFADESGDLVDLDEIEPAELAADLRNYLAVRLAELPGYRSPAQREIRGRLAAAVAARLSSPPSGSAGPRWGAFLVAGIFARFLDGRPPAQDPAAAEELGSGVPLTLSEVLEFDLGVRPVPGGLRELLAALAYAKGEGMPAELAGLVAAGFLGDSTEDVDPDSVFDAARFYLRTAIDSDGTTLYRLFHQGLADHLRRNPRHAPESGSDAIARAGLVLDRLLGPVLGTESGRWSTAAPYLVRHAIQHAIEADRVDDLVTDPEFLVHADPATLIPELHRAHTPPARRAAAVYRASAGRHRHLDSARRRRLLTVDAARYGMTTLTRRLSSGGGQESWIPRWATGSLVHPAHRDILHGHTDAVLKVACTTIGDRPVVVTAGKDQTLRVWDLATGNPIGGPPITITDWPHDLACTSVDGHAIALISCGDDEIQLWDLVTGQPFDDPLTIPTNTTVYAIECVIEEGTPVAYAGGFDGILYRWNLTTGESYEAAYHGSPIYTVACATAPDDEEIVLSGDKKGTVRFDGGRKLPGHEGCVNFVACIIVGGRRFAVTTTADRQIRIWDLTTSRPKATLLPGDDLPAYAPVACAEVDGRAVAVIGDYDNVQMWDLVTAKPIGAPFTAHTSQVNDVACTMLDGRPVAVTASDDTTVRVWDLAINQLPDNRIPGHIEQISAVGCAMIGDRMIAVTGGGEDGGVDLGLRVWDLAAGRSIGPPLIPEKFAGFVCDLASTTVNGRQVAVVGTSESNVVRVWDLATGRLFCPPLRGHEDYVKAVACTSFDGRPVAITGDGKSLRVWDLAAGTQIGDLVIGQDVLTIGCAEIGGRPAVLTCGFNEREVQVWDVTSRKRIGEPLKHLFPVWTVTGTVLDSRPVALTGAGDVFIWDLTTGLITGALEGEHPDAIRAIVCTTVNGRPAVVTGGDDATVRVWDLATRECLSELPMPNMVLALTVAPDGALVVCIDRDIVVFDQV